jgi:hypothetical protein
MATTPAPETVTDALAFLTGEGYTDEFHLDSAGLRCDRTGAHPLHEVVVDYRFRFEGPSDPGDEMIVLGVRVTDDGGKGFVVSAFGPAVDPEHAEVLAALSDRRPLR